MPRYELMYLLASTVADPDVPGVTEQIKKFIADFGGTEVEENQLGKKKLAYPIGKTRNGYYVVVGFTMDSRKVNDLDAKIRTQDNTIIRHLLINQEEFIARSKKDEVARAKLAAKRPVENIPAATAPATEVKEAKKEVPVLEEIDDKALEEKIEAALNEDLTK